MMNVNGHSVAADTSFGYFVYTCVDYIGEFATDLSLV
jgi:hypothetical protein